MMTLTKPITIFVMAAIALHACKPGKPSEEILAYVKEFDGKTLAEARQMLQAESEKVDGFISFMKHFKQEKPKHFKPAEEEVTKPYVQKSAAEMEARYTALFAQERGFRQEVQYPGSVADADGDFRGSSDFSDIATPDFTTSKLFFHDGATEEKQYAMDGSTVMPFVKTIDSVYAAASYGYPTKIVTLTLDQQHNKATFKGAEIKVDKMGDNRVRLLMGSKAAHDYLYIEALNKDGKPLDYTSKNNGVNNPDDMNRLLADFSKTLKSLLSKLDKGSFKDVVALQEEIKTQMPNGTPFDDAGQDGYVEGYFKGNVEKVNVYLADENFRGEHKMTLKNVAPNYSGLFMTMDEKNQTYGFIDASGKFVIPATYKKLSQINPYFFSSDDYNGYYYYRLDTAAKKLVKLEYEVKELTAQLATVSRPDVRNGAGVMDGAGHLLIPANYESIFLDPAEPILYANKYEPDGPLQGANYLYDYSGRLISPDAYYTNGETYHNGLLLVRDKASRIYFVDSKGKKAIDLKGYVEAEPFSDGLARVKNANDQFGFINTSGALVIPCSYTSASSFNEGVSMVYRQRNNAPEVTLINTKNEPLLPFVESSSASGQTGEGAKREYDIEGKKFNAKGVAIQ